MNKNKIIKGIIIFSLSLILLMQNIISYAEPVAVTKENLTDAFKKMEELSNKEIKDEKEKIKIVVNDKDIVFKTPEGDYKIGYDISDKPTFTYEMDINKGMKYTEFKDKYDAITIINYGYMAVANVQGIEFEDSAMYIMLSALNFNRPNTSKFYQIELNESKPDSNSYSSHPILVEGIDTKKITESEFPDKVIEFIDCIYYDEKQTNTDLKDANTFVITEEKNKISDSSRKIVYTLTVNLDGDFEKVKNTTKDLENSLGNTVNTIGGQISNAIENEINSSNNNINQNSNTTLQKYPYAGLETNILVPILSCLIGILAIFLLIMLAKIKKLDK